MKSEGMGGDEPWVKPLQAFISRGPASILRLRGLPYECTASQVTDFFRRGTQPCEVMGGESGVFFVKKNDGKSTGDAFVLFANEDDVTAAMSKHKELIGSRYIEIFRIAFTEVEQVVRRTLEAKSKPPVARLTQTLAVAPPPPQTTIPCGPARDCIRLRGLPFETQVQHLLDFLGSHSKSIVYQGVHMVYNHLGHPIGEAFVQMGTETSASLAAIQCHNGLLTVGKKQRYVEVFQCSGEDMSAFLSGGSPTLSSPGMELPQVESPELYYQPMLKHPCYSIPPPGYPQWSTETYSAAKTTTTDALPPGPKPTELELYPQPDVYQYAYPPQNPIYYMPRIQTVPCYPKAAFSPVLMPQLTPLGMGLLSMNMKRSWEQAFPMETPLQAAKRWQPGLPTPGFFHDL